MDAAAVRQVERMVERSTPDVERAIAVISGHRDHERMQLTIEASAAPLREHPNDPVVLDEVGGAYDTAFGTAAELRRPEAGGSPF